MLILLLMISPLLVTVQANTPARIAPLCGPNEHVECQSSKCQWRCDNYYLEPMAGACQPSTDCFCDEGYVRNEYDCCILKELCPNNKERPVCSDPNAYLSECTTTCERTCYNRYRGDGRVCIASCNTPGCVCKENYLKNDNGVCVPISQCSPPRCNDDEVYNRCGTTCEPSCDTVGDTCQVCTKQCVDGCFCKPGLIRAPDGSCIEPRKCPVRICPGDNEYFDNCPPNCPTQNCSAIWSRFDCRNASKCCKPQCRCIDGYYRNADGVCVSTDECINGPTCKENASFTTCGTECPPTCLEPGPRVCTDVCKRGCQCNAGFVLDPDGNCVKPENCPNACGPNSRYNSCGTACPRTCDNPNPRPCTKQCNPGCQCDPGFILDAYNNCIRPEQCPSQPICPNNEFYSTCGPCEGDCINKGQNISCVAACFEGCFCNKGLVRNDKRVCVRPEQCPPRPKICPMNEFYSTCGPCEGNCVNKGQNISCVAACYEGCFCNKGLVRNPKGYCVPPSLCPRNPQVCPKNEFYSNCGFEESCEGPARASMASKCFTGCFCRKGYVRNAQNQCVKRSQCPPPKTCPPNEEYSTCGTCELTCANKDTPFACAAVCLVGCFCKGNLVRNAQGFCVPPESCPAPVCPKGEHFEQCGTACPRTCDKPYDQNRLCTKECVTGCTCNDGLVRNAEGRCVPWDKCPKPSCPANQTYVYCNAPCPSDFCPESNNPVPQCSPPYPCLPGCKCNDGFKRLEDSDCCIPAEECPEPIICSPNEVYQSCGTACPRTCNRPYPESCTEECVSDCFCAGDLVRDEVSGKCIPLDQCPPERRCPANEHYETCGTSCPETCDNDELADCTAECIVGCFCDDGYVRNKSGICVPRERCNIADRSENKVQRVPMSLKIPECNINEHYEACGSPCPATCDDDVNTSCGLQCVSGCFCNDGYIRDQWGFCVPRDTICPSQITCAKDEYFSLCGTACEASCAYPYPKYCSNKCVQGCFCKAGLVRDTGGRCIRPEKCPGQNPQCNGPNEVYLECGSACPQTCSNLKSNQICTQQCVPGCFCQKGYVRNDAGQCVLPEDCNVQPICPKNEIYYQCVPCNPSCQTRDVGVACAAVCQPGCDCSEGYIRDDNTGRCILPEQCPNNQCGKNQQYYLCKPCRPSCKTKDQQIACAAVCIPGCDCMESYIKNDATGECVLPEQCPVPFDCGKYEEYTDCRATPCTPETCDTLYTAYTCFVQPPCEPGCKCIDGYLRNVTNEDKCIPQELCPLPPPNQCSGQNEVFQECGTACPKTCRNLKETNRVCTQQCVRGCFCAQGYVRDDYGQCIKPENCYLPPTICPINEEYQSCGTACPKTCRTKDINFQCIAQCKPGCFCKPGLVRNDQGTCIPPEKCPPPNQCSGQNEVYQQCGTACPATCNSINQPDKVCTLQCVSGCFCAQGYVRNDAGQCVRPEDCEAIPICPINEEYNSCGPSCAATCDNKDLALPCAPVCVKGCFCKGNLVRNSAGVCVPPEQCPPPNQCSGQNEVYQQCGTACPATCNSINQPDQVCTLQCVSGCFCAQGYVRNDAGQCVRPEDCEVIPICPINEEYNSCGPSCAATCDNKDLALPCVPVCVKGCFCKGNLVRNSAGVCVPPEQCPPKCTGANEVYKTCGTACPATCRNINTPNKKCKAVCVQGCFCADGYVRNDAGQCVLPRDCYLPPIVCPPNEQYQTCGTACPKTCANKDDEVSCIEACQRGCFCKRGLVRNDRGVCVTPDKCPPTDVCGPNKVFKKCGTPCPLTCRNVILVTPVRPCARRCVQGCFCVDGYVENDAGQCVKPEECTQIERICPPNEEYNKCGTLCPKTCANKDYQIRCIAGCNADCFCKEGFVRNDQGVCVIPERCPPIEICGPNEVFKECGTACPLTCKNLNATSRPCARLCIRGCFCADGYAKNDDGQCVRVEDCPTPKVCPPNEEYNECGTLCPKTCANKDIAINCLAGCKADCFCKEGFVRNDQGVCVLPESCPPKDKCTGENEEYTTCGSACPDTCANRNDTNRVCTLQCVVGCFCKQGYVRNDDGSCVRPEQCPVYICPKNEEYNSCGTACPKTCKNKDVEISCIAVCKAGCFCKDGLVRNDQGKCVPPETCPSKNECALNEIYTTCGSPCRKTCANRNETSTVCTQQCVAGCVCKQGHVINDDGFCVRPELCPAAPGNCLDNEEYSECGPVCPKTCRNRYRTDPCEERCKTGCFCKDGLVRDDQGKCIPPDNCPPVNCPLNEHYEECGSACPRTCQKPYPQDQLCTANCVPGCTCDDGFVRNDEDLCVSWELCPKPVCPANQTYVYCNAGCPTDYCRTNNGPQPQCSPPYPCPPGCRCKPGYLKSNYDDSCILESDCPPPLECGEDEYYNDCGSACPETCDSDPNPLCPAVCVEGCFCRYGLVRDTKTGKCVPKSECSCKENEVYDCHPTCPPLFCESIYTSYDCSNAPNCTYQCDCLPGYLRNGPNRDTDVCVPNEECPPPKPYCPDNEEYLECGSSCPPTCDSSEDMICTDECNPGCFCKDGLVRNDYGECVPREECPKTCPRNEHWATCGKSCPKTCKNPNPKICPHVCIPGCTCDDGLVRNEAGQCVPLNKCKECGLNEVYDCQPTCPPLFCESIYTSYDCSKAPNCTYQCDCQPGFLRNGPNRDTDVCVPNEECPPPKPTCPDNEEYLECGSSCPPTCDSSDDIICTTDCNPGCFCKDGLVRNDDGECIPREECQECGINEVYDCHPTCPPLFCESIYTSYDCSNAPNCTYQCDCLPGYLRVGPNRDTDVCVPNEACPPPNVSCPDNEEYLECGSACPPTCDSKNYTICTDKCVEGCFCKDGLVRNYDGVCVPRDQCPPKCGKDEHYEQCGLSCPKTCDNPNPKFCPRICKSGCVCNDGLVRSPDGRCVTLDKCPKKCGANEEYKCRTSCPPQTCESILALYKCDNKTACVNGCYCKDGYLRNGTVDDPCIPSDQCGISCPQFEHYDRCGGSCAMTCENPDPGYCTEACVPGCTCDEGLLRNEYGYCVAPEYCSLKPQDDTDDCPLE